MPKSREKIANGSDEGSAIVAPAIDARSVFVRPESVSMGVAAEASEAAPSVAPSDPPAARTMMDRMIDIGGKICAVADLTHAGAGASGSPRVRRSQHAVFIASRPTTRKARSSCDARSYTTEPTSSAETYEKT